MKLKKIASLMLAGIMAVSMLAGCKSGSSNNSNAGSSSSEPTSVGSASEGINAELNRNKNMIKFGSNEKLENAVKAYFASNPIEADRWSNQTANKMENAGNGIAKIVGDTYKNPNVFATQLEDDTTTTKATYLTVYGFNTEYYTKDAALKLVGKAIDELDLPKDTSNITDAKVYTYAGNAYVVEVESEKGTESVWAVVVEVTKDYTAA